MEKEMRSKMIGHNEPPKTIDDFLIYNQDGKLELGPICKDCYQANKK